MLYYLVFWVIFILAIVTTVKCWLKLNGHFTTLVTVLFGLAISMIIPGYGVSWKFPNGIEGKAGSPPLLTQLFSKEKQTNFTLENKSKKEEKIKIKLHSTDPIENVALDQRNSLFNIIEGGTGNTYLVYQVTMPPGQTASGSVVSTNTVLFEPLLQRQKP